MCFSAEADFVSGAVTGAIGIAALTQARGARELPLAVLPLAFGLHQITEGFVWLGLEGKSSAAVGDVATYLYLAFAWALLPLLAPLAVILVEPLRARRRWMAALVILGGLVGVLLAERLVNGAITSEITDRTITYGGAGDLGTWLTVGYVIATCGSFVLSSRRYIVWFGVANLAAVAVVAGVQAEALTSLWCVWAAIMSVLIFLQLRAWRRGDDVPGGPTTAWAIARTAGRTSDRTSGRTGAVIR